MKVVILSLVAIVGAAVVGCAAESTAPDVVDDVEVAEATSEPQQVMTSVNGDGTWTADALPPFTSAVSTYAKGRATFTGPAGATRAMGVCLLRVLDTACNTVADCSSAPVTLPTGGFRYCTAPNGTGQKYCAYRPGPPASYCAGTPALPPVNGLPQKVGPGTYNSPQTATGSGWKYISYACMEGCVATDPSSSSVQATMCHIDWPGADYCEDFNCDGSPESCWINGRRVRPQ
jgi:hypothetical protein